MKTMYPLHKFTSDEIAQFRMKVITFASEHGLVATGEAFDVSRATIYIWRKKLEGNGPAALVPTSTRPKTTRRMQTDERVLEFIRNLRENNPRFGKRKVYILLNIYCQALGISTPKVSTIGKIIKRNNLFFSKSGRVYHNPNNKPTIPGVKLKKERLAKGFRVKEEGELVQIDTVVRFDLGLKRYILTAIDLYTRFSFAFSYHKLNSEVSLDFFKKLELICPFKICAVKSDNGLEFQRHFHQYLVRRNVIHYFSYPRTPTSNAYVERFNRTIQEEFVDQNLDTISDTRTFNQKLMDWLLFYNTVRPHQSLEYMTPVDYLLKGGKKSNMYGAHTRF